MLDFICTFVLLYIVISIIWPRLGSSPVANDRKHREVLRAIAKLERPHRACRSSFPAAYVQQR